LKQFCIGDENFIAFGICLDFRGTSCIGCYHLKRSRGNPHVQIASQPCKREIDRKHSRSSNSDK
jgi:hypothetical protein